MSDKQFPIDYNPPRTFYLVSYRYCDPKITEIVAHRQTIYQYMVVKGSVRVLVGGIIVSTGAERVWKKKTAVVETIPDALQWLWVKAVDDELACKAAYESAAERVEQIQTCMDKEDEQPGIFLQLIAEVDTRRRARFVQLQEVSE